MRQVDAAVIGGGVLGCFAARNLRRWNISTVLIEKAEDVCTGITRANSAIVYPGYDNRPGSRKAQMTVAGNAGFPELCEELEVPFRRMGSLMAGFGAKADQILDEKLKQGIANGVPGLRLLSGEEAREREPFLSKNVTSALYAPTAGTVNPWLLGIAAYENACYNGCEAFFNTQVFGIRGSRGGYILETSAGGIFCKAILNCAGLYADQVQELLFPPSVRLIWDASDFLILDKQTPGPSHILFQECGDNGKGITAVPTVEGNLLLEGIKRPLEGKPWATVQAGLERLQTMAAQMLPEVDLGQVIRSFAAVRPNPQRVVWRDGNYVPDGTSLGSFVIEHPAPGFYSLIGIKTPGLTCAQELGFYLAKETAAYLEAPENPGFDPHRRAIAEKDNTVICQCGGITQAEILEAVRRGASTVDGVKRRAGSGMGACQGSRCGRLIEELLKAHGTV